MHRFISAGLAILTVTACDEGGPPPSAVPRDSAGIQIVESRVPKWQNSEGWQLAADPFLSIGAAAGVGGEYLYDIVDVDMLSDGRLGLTSRGTNELRLYSQEGDYLGSLGREGRGPGEFISPEETWVGSSDSLFVKAFQNLVVFDGSGSFVRSHGVPTWPLRARFEDGSYLFVKTLAGSDRFEPGYSRPRALLLKANAEGMNPDTLSDVAGSELYRFATSGGTVTFPAPFGAVRLASVAGDMVLTTDGESGEIHRVDSSGLVEVLRPMLRRRQVTLEDVRGLEQAILESAPPEARPGRRRLFEKWRYPDYFPAFDRLLVDASSTIWARQYQTDPMHGGMWTLFDSAGYWLGEVMTPARFEVMMVEDDVVGGVWLDELDVEYVRLYRVEKPADRLVP